MKGSKYDTDKDGMCSAKACKDVLQITDTAPWTEDAAVIESREEDRHHVQAREIKDAYPTIRRRRRTSPLVERPGWGKDYADPFDLLRAAFRRPQLIPTGNTNYSLVGLTPAQARK